MDPPDSPATSPVVGRPPSGKPSPKERATAAKTSPPAAASAPKQPKGLVVKVLALTDKAVPAFRTAAENFLQQGLGLSARDAKASTTELAAWSELPRILRRYAKIDRLVLMAHGSPGALNVGGHIRGLDLVAKELTPPMPTVSEIDFEACNLGSSPAELVAFGRALGAARASAFNHYLVGSPIRFNIPANVDVKALAEMLKIYEPWLLANHPTVEHLAKSRGTVWLAAEWFRDTYNDSKLPSNLTSSSAEAIRRTFKPRSSARERRLTAADALSRANQDEGPAVPLERIVITLK